LQRENAISGRLPELENKDLQPSRTDVEKIVDYFRKAAGETR
jgi:hypothetical protein